MLYIHHSLFDKGKDLKSTYKNLSNHNELIVLQNVTEIAIMLYLHVHYIQSDTDVSMLKDTQC